MNRETASVAGGLRESVAIRRVIVWRAWADTFWPWIDTHREMFPFIHAIYNAHMAPADQRGLMARTWRHVSGRSARLPAGSAAPGYPRCDALFVALGDRANCIGVGRRLDAALRRGSLPLRLAYFQPVEEMIITGPDAAAGGVVTMQRHVRPGWVRRLLALTGFVWRVGIRNPVVRAFLIRHPILVPLTLLKAIVRCDSADRVLLETGARMVIAGNEGGVSNGGAALFVAARQKGIRTVQYLHGMPHLMEFPFLSDEFWVWSDHTIEMFRRQGASDALLARMIPIGSLEYADDDCGPMASGGAAAPDGKQRVLIFSQLSSDRGWGTRVYSIMAGQMADALADLANVRVRVRLHPNERADEAARWRLFLRGVPWELSPRGASLEDDVAWCTHAYSNGSTAILAVLRAGKASYLVWDDKINAIHGCPPFPETYVLRTAEEIRRSLARPWDPSESDRILQALANPRGAIGRAVSRMLEIAAEGRNHEPT